MAKMEDPSVNPLTPMTPEQAEALMQVLTFDDTSANLPTAFKNYMLTYDPASMTDELQANLLDAFVAGAAGSIKSELDWWPQILAYVEMRYNLKPAAAAAGEEDR